MQAHIKILNRLFPGTDTSTIDVRLDPERQMERYTVRAEGNRLVIDAGSRPAVGVALNHWLHETARAHVSFLDTQPGLLCGAPLPLPERPLHGETWASVRYALNYCFFSYSAAYWDWPEWERLI